MAWSLRTADRVELRVHGPETPRRPVALILHGVGSTADFARRCLAGPLGDLGYDVVAPDLRGHGDSTPLPDPVDHSLAAHVSDLAVLADRLPVRLVAGISLGAEVALRWITAAAPPLDGAVLCLPGVSGPRSSAAAANRAAADELSRLGVDAVLAQMPDAAGALPWVVAEVQASWRRHEPASLVAALRAVAEYDAFDEATAGLVRVPVGLVGVTDDAAHPAATTDALSALLPTATVEWLRLADLAADRATLGRAAVRALTGARLLCADPEPG